MNRALTAAVVPPVLVTRKRTLPETSQDAYVPCSKEENVRESSVAPVAASTTSMRWLLRPKSQSTRYSVTRWAFPSVKSAAIVNASDVQAEAISALVWGCARARSSSVYRLQTVADAPETETDAYVG